MPGTARQAVSGEPAPGNGVQPPDQPANKPTAASRAKIQAPSRPTAPANDVKIRHHVPHRTQLAGGESKN